MSAFCTLLQVAELDDATLIADDPFTLIAPDADNDADTLIAITPRLTFSANPEVVQVVDALIEPDVLILEPLTAVADDELEVVRNSAEP